MRSTLRRLRLNIYAKVLLVVLSPLVIMIALLGYYSVESRLEDVRNVHEERGRLVARSLSLSSEFGMFSGDTETLQGLVERLVEDNRDVDSAALLDQASKVVAQSAGFSISDLETLPGPGSGKEAPYSVFLSPVRTRLPGVSDFQEEIAGYGDESARFDNRVLGWAVVRLSKSLSQERRRAVLARSAFTIGLSLVISILLSVVIGKSITLRIRRLSGTIGRLGEGDLSARVGAPSKDEFGELEDGFNTMADALESAHETLQQRVSDATLKLRDTVSTLREKNEALEVATSKAMEAGREKADFLARMSHEIRTPLNAVIGFSRIIRRSDDIEKTREHAATIDTAANQLLHVVDGILDFSRLESGNMELESVRFDLADQLENSVIMLRSQAHAKGLELILHLHNGLPKTIRSDPHRLGQALINLVSNAIKFTRQGHVCVEASFDYTSKLEGLLAIRVSDTGIGLTLDERERLFRPFVQADSSITRLYGGTGLGLSIANQIVSLLGGEIDVSSEKDAGSAFSFSIPCETGGDAAPLDPGLRLEGYTGLVYDKNPFTRRAILSMLMETGAALFSVSDPAGLWGNEETGSAAGRKVDFIVAGLSLDRDRQLVDSLEAEVEKGFSKPVLLLIDKEQWNPPKRIAAAPSIDWSTKPARRRRLLNQIRGVLDFDESTRPARKPAIPRVTGAGGPRPLRVLFAEDNEFNREYLRSVLEERGIGVVEAGNGEDAVARAVGQTFDLVFLDIHMPMMDGIEVCRQIRRQLGAKAPPIIALTADLFFDTRGEAVKGLFDGQLFKPVTPESLDAVIDEWAGNASLRQRPGAPAREAPGGPFPGDAGALHAAGVNLSPNLSKQLARELHRLGTRLVETYQTGSWADFASTSHQFHGLVTLYGEEGLTAAAEEFERAGRTASRAGLEERMREFAGLIEGLRDRLEDGTE